MTWQPPGRAPGPTPSNSAPRSGSTASSGDGCSNWTWVRRPAAERTRRGAQLACPAHMYPDRGAVLAGAQLDQVAHLVDQPQTMAAVVGAVPDPPGQRIGDPPAVVDLTEDLLGGMPDVDHPAP